MVGSLASLGGLTGWSILYNIYRTLKQWNHQFHSIRLMREFIIMQTQNVSMWKCSHVELSSKWSLHKNIPPAHKKSNLLFMSGYWYLKIKNIAYIKIKCQFVGKKHRVICHIRNDLRDTST